MNKNDGGPAFPVPNYVNADGESFISTPSGMSLRDYFAAMAMQAMIAKRKSIAPDDSDDADDKGFDYVSLCAYSQAQSMLKARSL